MKKYTKVLALALALTMLLSMSVFAADYEVTGVGENAVTYDETLPKFDLTLPAESGEMYLLLVLNGADEIPTANNILYVNQATASDGTVIFEDVYPKAIANSTIYLAGGELSGLTAVANIVPEEADILLGDINGDKNIDNKDLVLLKRYASNPGKYPLEGDGLKAADTNPDDAVDNKDIVVLKRFLSNPSKYPIAK